jgi:hypothetical protein
MPETNLDASLAVKPEDRSLSVRGLWEVFLKPTELFKKLVDRPKILVPYIVVIVLMAISVFTTLPYLANDVFSNPELQAKMSEQLKSQPGVTPEMAKEGWTIFMSGASFLIYSLLPLAVAGLALFWGNFVFGSRSSFRLLLSIVLYAEVVYWLGECLMIPLVISKGSALVTISPAVLFVEQAFSGIMYSLMSKFSLFHIWEIVVLVIGFAIAFKITKGKALAAALGSMGFMTLLGLSLLLLSK